MREYDIGECGYTGARHEPELLGERITAVNPTAAFKLYLAEHPSLTGVKLYGSGRISCDAGELGRHYIRAVGVAQ